MARSRCTTLDGHVTMTIPPGTQPSRRFRLRGKGIKGMKSGEFGDLYVQVQVETPTHLTAEQKELYRQLDATLKRERAESGGVTRLVNCGTFPRAGRSGWMRGNDDEHDGIGSPCLSAITTKSSA